MGVPFEVPSLVVGFDVETTGLDTRYDEPISYGFAEYGEGSFRSRDQYFVLPGVQIHPGAERVHGVSFEHLRRKFREGTAISPAVGASRAARRLAAYVARGATFVGANPMFDFSMLESTLTRYLGNGLASFDVDLATMALIDIVENDRLIDPDFTSRPRRGLAALSVYYGVQPGLHQASEDARAAVEVFVSQIVRVQKSLDAARPVTSVVFA